MATKKSVFLSTRTVEWIEGTTKKANFDEAPKWSESINATFEQFRFLLKNALPEFSTAEWEIILNVYAGCYFPAHGVPARIASDMMDNLGEVDLEKLTEFHPEYASLVRKTHAMTQVEQLAVLYFVQIFWSNNWTSEWDEVVKTIKERL